MLTLVFGAVALLVNLVFMIVYFGWPPELPGLLWHGAVILAIGIACYGRLAGMWSDRQGLVAVAFILVILGVGNFVTLQAR